MSEAQRTQAVQQDDPEETLRRAQEAEKAAEEAEAAEKLARSGK